MDKPLYSTEEPPLPMPMPVDIGPIDARRWRMGVGTDIHPGGLIVQTIDLAGEVQRRVLDTAEQQVRNALIALGWTPPSDTEQS